MATVGIVPAAPHRDPGLGVATAQHPEIPLRLRIPRLRVDAAIAPVEIGADGALAVPDDPSVVGWWTGGAAARSGTGTIVIDGHVDTYDRGAGALFRIADLQPGDGVGIGIASATVQYVVAAVRSYRKDALPSAVFDQEVAPRLVLISCGGPFDRRKRHYRDNIVVYAVPVTGATILGNLP